jgi:uncharacterized protein (TIGR02001 family)
MAASPRSSQKSASDLEIQASRHGAAAGGRDVTSQDTWIAGRLHHWLSASLASLLVGGCGPAVANSDAIPFSASVTLASDYMLRGFSQTKGNPALQGGIAWTGPSGWMAGAWGSSVDFVDEDLPSDGAHVELDTYVGHSWSLSERLAFDATLIRYTYPGTVPGVSYDYNELIFGFHAGDRVSATMIYSNDAFGTAQPALLYEIAAQYPLPHGLELSGRLGYYDLDQAFGSGYAYYGIGLAKSFGRLTLEWRYDGADGAGRRLWGDDADPRLTLQLSAEL